MTSGVGLGVGGGGGGGAEKLAYVVQWDRHGALQLITIAQVFFNFLPVALNKVLFQYKKGNRSFHFQAAKS